MTEEKGLNPAVADKIGTYVNFKGGRDLLSKLSSDETLSANPSAKKGLNDMTLLFDYLDIFGVLDKISLDMSLARGLELHWRDSGSCRRRLGASQHREYRGTESAAGREERKKRFRGCG